jgi:hypothetical protein
MAFPLSVHVSGIMRGGEPVQAECWSLLCHHTTFHDRMMVKGPMLGCLVKGFTLV